MGYGINFWAMRAWDETAGGGATGKLRDERRRAFDEDEFLRCSAVQAADRIRRRPFAAPSDDEAIRRKYMLPERYVLTLMTAETFGQELLLLDLMERGRLAVDLVICGRRSFYSDGLLRAARRRRLAQRTNFIYEYTPDELGAFCRMADGMVYLPAGREHVQPVVEAVCAGTPVILSDTRRNRLAAGAAARYVPCCEPEALAEALDRMLR